AAAPSRWWGGRRNQFVPRPIAGNHLGAQGFALVRRRVPGRPGALPIPVAHHVTIQFGGTVWTQPQVITLGDQLLTPDARVSVRRMLVCHWPSSFLRCPVLA